jgi:hypothetical protein
VILRHLAVLVAGAAVALAAVAVHRMGVPGLALAIAASVAVPWWLRGSGDPRLAASYGAGWLVVFALVLLGRPEGDYAIASDPAGYALIVTALVVVALALVGLSGRRER